MDQRVTAVKICPACHTAMVEGACYCHMCGMSVKAALEDALRRMREGEIPLYSYSFQARGRTR